jgi:hypothetical protein
MQILEFIPVIIIVGENSYDGFRALYKHMR